MRTGRPRTPTGTHGAINTRRERGRVVAETRVRDLDGRLRQVRASGPTAAAARSRLLERIRERPSLPSAGVLRPTSSFADLADLWLSDLELRDRTASRPAQMQRGASDAELPIGRPLAMNDAGSSRCGATLPSGWVRDQGSRLGRPDDSQGTTGRSTTRAREIA
jgi:hypothetical protein